MKERERVLVLLVLLAGLTASAAEGVLVEGSVVEQKDALLAGVQYQVIYDEATGVVTFKLKGNSSAAGCTIIYQVIGVVDDAGKAVNGYLRNCAATSPAPTTCC